jgi:protein-serine/threonine kinase
MIFGTTPFKGPNRHATFSNVLRHEVHFPDSPTTSSLCRQIVRKLLVKDEHRRLGSQSGASEVKAHKWFAPLNWGLLRNSKPPIVPAATNGLDTVNFRNMKDSKSLDLDGQMRGKAGKAGTTDDGEDPFVDFSSLTRQHDGDF